MGECIGGSAKPGAHCQGRYSEVRKQRAPNSFWALVKRKNENETPHSPNPASVFCWPEGVHCNLEIERQMACGGGAPLLSQGGEMCLRSASLPCTWSLSHTSSVKPGSSLQRGTVCSGPDSSSLSNAACSDLPPARTSWPGPLNPFKRPRPK